MLFALVCEDKAEHEELRKATREDHLAYIKNFDVQMAGPMLSDDEQTMIGSLILLEADTLAAAKQFAKDDPYALAGLFKAGQHSAIQASHWLDGVEDMPTR